MDTARALYRIMTKKSQMKFGRYAELLVGDVMNLDPTYIPYCYFNCSNISFSKDIRDELQLPDLQKPGVYPAEWSEYKQKIWSDKYDGLSEEDFMHKRHAEKCAIRRMDTAKQIRREIACRRSSFKSVLQARNHGHIK